MWDELLGNRRYVESLLLLLLEVDGCIGLKQISLGGAGTVEIALKHWEIKIVRKARVCMSDVRV